MHVGDLVYANAVEHPTDEKFIKVFLSANRGAASGLAKLQVLEGVNSTSPSKLCTERRCHITMELYRRTKRKLHAAGCGHLMPDIIHFEHLLCKIVRTMEKGPQSYSLFEKRVVTSTRKRKTAQASKGKKGGQKSKGKKSVQK